MQEEIRHLLVLGAGPIGCEMAQSLARLGSRVTLFDLAPRLLPREDEDMSAVVNAQFKQEGIDLHLGIQVIKVERNNGELRVLLEHPKQGQYWLSGSHLLIAAGRKANLDSLGLEQAGDILAKLIELVIGEASGRRFGSDSVVERLCDSFFVLVIRYCIEEGLVGKGVFAVMQDRRLATVLGLIHQQPWQPWTVAELCSRAGLSKTVLSEKFALFLDASPIEYLTLWRMQIAAHWLKEPGMTVERVAERCGYESVPAFSKAFKRSFGVSPGSFHRSKASE